MSAHTVPAPRHSSVRVAAVTTTRNAIVGWLFVAAVLSGGAASANQYADTACPTMTAATATPEALAVCDALVAAQDAVGA